MAVDMSIAISAKDRYSDVVTKIRQTQAAFRKDLEGTQKSLEKFNQTKITLKADLNAAKKELKESTAEFKKLGDEVSRQKMLDAQLNYDNIKDNLGAVSKAAKQAQKDMDNMSGAFSKTENRMNGNKNGGILSVLGKAGIFNMVGDTLSLAANTYVSSAFGSEAGTMVGNALSGAATGAAIGSIVPGIGTAIGAAAGTVLGAAEGATQVFQQRDDAFKGVVRSEYNRVKAEESGFLASSSQMAGTREQLMKKGTVVFGGAAEAKQMLADVQQYALDTPFNYDMIAQQAVKMRASGVANADIMDRIKQIGDLSMGDVAAFESIARQYTQANAKGKAQTQDLTIMAEAGVQIYEALAKVKNTDVAGIFNMLDKGNIYIQDLNDAFDQLTGEGGRLKGMMGELAGTFPALTAQKAEVDELMNIAMGEGYNDARKKGLEADISWKTGIEGDKMKEAYSMMGAFQAELENEREQIQRDSISKMMESEAYKAAIENGNAAEAGKLIAEAKVKAENEYKKSDGFQLQLEADKGLVESTRDALSDSWYDYGYSMEKEFQKGMDAAKKYEKYPGEYKIKGNDITGGFMGKAFGMSYVPYDDFPVRLHQGERVLTASEARNSSSSGSVVIGGNNFYIREEADITKIAQALLAGLRDAKVGFANA